MMAPKVDMPNYNESIDQIDYKRLVLLGQKSTATTYVDRAALANEEEATIRILKPEETDKTARQLLLGLDGKTMTVFSFTMEEYVAMIAEQEGTLTYIPMMSELANGGSRQSGSPQSRTQQISCVGTWRKDTQRHRQAQ